MGGVEIRGARPDDWLQIWPFFRDIVTEGETDAYPDDITAEQAQDLWTLGPDGFTAVAMDGDEVMGVALMQPNRPGRGSHVATASFMVSPAARGHGVGRRLGEYALGWAKDAGFRAMQFNAVAASNPAAVALYESLGFAVMATIPGGFRHPDQGYVALLVMHRAL